MHESLHSTASFISTPMELLRWPGDKLRVGPWVTLQGQNWMCRQNSALIKYGTGLPAGLGSRRAYLQIWCAVHLPECTRKHRCDCAKAVSMCMDNCWCELEWQPVGFENTDTDIIHCDGALQTFIFLLSYLLSFAVSRCALPAVCMELLKLYSLHSFKSVFKKCVKNTCPQTCNRHTAKWDVQRRHWRIWNIERGGNQVSCSFSRVMIFHASLSGIRK